MVAGLRDADVCALSLWCPAPDVVYNMKHKMLCGVDVSDIEEKGYADYEGLRVGLGFYQDALELDPYAVAAKFTKRVNLVHGDEDVTASIHCSERYKEIYGDRAEFLVVHGAEHRFKSCAFLGRPDGLGSGIPDPGAAGLNGGTPAAPRARSRAAVQSRREKREWIRQRQSRRGRPQLRLSP